MHVYHIRMSIAGDKNNVYHFCTCDVDQTAVSLEQTLAIFGRILNMNCMDTNKMVPLVAMPPAKRIGFHHVKCEVRTAPQIGVPKSDVMLDNANIIPIRAPISDISGVRCDINEGANAMKPPKK